MANTLTGLIPTIYTALDTVSREMIGFIPNVSSDISADGAAKDQTVRAPVAPAIALEDITPGADPADSGDAVVTYTDVTISKAKVAPIRWNGEQQLSVSRFGQYNTILADQFTQAFRAIANEVEADLAALYVDMARAYGTATTTPFATADDHTDFAGANRILDELGAPQGDRVMILGSAARANLEGKQSGLFKVNEAGDGGAMLRNRDQRMLHGFTLGYSSGIGVHTKGTATGIDADGGEPVGETTVAFDGGDGGTLLAGDVVTFAGDSTKYVVATGDAAATSGSFTLGEPGLAATLADTVEMTIGGSYTANMFFHRNALLLAARTPAMPMGGDSADDVTTVTDPVSGLTFQVAVYRQYKRVKYEVGLAWGVAAPNGKHGGILLG
jgi:hypothetical protein